MSEEKNKERRIGGKNYWMLHDAARNRDKVQEKYSDWLRKEARKYDCYVDQIENVLTGKVRKDEGASMQCPQCGLSLWRGPIRRIGDKFIISAEKEFAKLRAAKEKLDDLKIVVAKKYKTCPDLIEPGTGRIKDADIEFLDEPEETEEKA